MDKEHYFRITDFLEDESFVAWVKRSNPEDVAFWDQWLLDNPGKRELADEAATIISGILFAPKTTSDAQVESALEKLNRKVDQHGATSSRWKSPYNDRAKGWIAAACIALIIAMTFALQSVLQTKEIVYRTAFGEQLDIKLSDGTLVILNANSTLTLPTNNPRYVRLEGEAFFEVEKKPSTKAKFLVHTEDLVIEVLGTAFNVNNRLEKTQVVLEEGVIQLNLKNGEQKTMAPGDLISYSAKSNQVVESRQKVRAELHTSWKDGTLLFENISLQKAMKKIQETYGMQAIFQNPEVAARKITLAVPTRNLDICIVAFEKALNIDIEHTNSDQLVIKGK